MSGTSARGSGHLQRIGVDCAFQSPVCRHRKLPLSWRNEAHTLWSRTAGHAGDHLTSVTAQHPSSTEEGQEAHGSSQTAVSLSFTPLYNSPFTLCQGAETTHVLVFPENDPNQQTLSKTCWEDDTHLSTPPQPWVCP